MRRLVPILAVCVVVSMPACGRYARHQAAAPTTAGGDAEYGSPGALPDLPREPKTTSPVPGAPPTTAARTGTTASAARSGLATNQSRRTDASGFRLTLTVDGDLSYSTGDSFLLQLDVENTTGERLYSDVQADFFALRPTDGSTNEERTWTDANCAHTLEGQDPDSSVAIAYEPGERVTLAKKSYPGGDRCRVPAGRYYVFGVLDWCPPASVDRRETGAHCDHEQVKRIASAPVAVTIT